MKLNFKVNFVEIHTYRSCKQYTEPTQKNTNAWSVAIQTQPRYFVFLLMQLTIYDSKLAYIVLCSVIFFCITSPKHRFLRNLDFATFSNLNTIKGTQVY